MSDELELDDYASRQKVRARVAAELLAGGTSVSRVQALRVLSGVIDAFEKAAYREVEDERDRHDSAELTRIRQAREGCDTGQWIYETVEEVEYLPDGEGDES